jgi:hypothetical protein
MSNIVILTSRTYIPKLLNFSYIILVINHIHINYSYYKISIFETHNPKTISSITSELNLPNTFQQTDLFLKSFSLQQFTFELIL